MVDRLIELIIAAIIALMGLLLIAYLNGISLS